MVHFHANADLGLLVQHQRAIQADEFGDKGLAVQLEDMVRDESGHADESEHILRDWPL